MADTKLRSHEPPGTGKTTAVQTLPHAWRAWFGPVVVTDRSLKATLLP